MDKTLIIIALWNIVVFAMYGTDKLKAKTHSRRIREATLIWPAFLLGGAGAMFGMVIFNHKTSKIKFRICIPLAVAVNVAMMISLVEFMK